MAHAAAYFAFAAAAIALVALRVAFLTLDKMKEQIKLANREIDLVQQDLENNRRMVDEATRHPDLRPTPDTFASGAGVQPPFSTGFAVELHVWVANLGERISRSVAAEWLIPRAALANEARYPKRVVFGEEWCIIETGFRSDLYFWPNGVPEQGPGASCSLLPDIQETPILLRFYDDSGTYPRGSWYRYRLQRENAEDGTALRTMLEPLFCLVPWRS